MICLTNATSPPVTILSVGEAVLIDLGSGRSSERLVNSPQASRLLPKNGGLHIQKSYVASSSTAPHSLVAGDTCTTVQGHHHKLYSYTEYNNTYTKQSNITEHNNLKKVCNVSFETMTAEIICKKLKKKSKHKKISTCGDDRNV